MGVAVWHDEAGALSCLRTDRAEDVGRLGALVMGRRGTGAATRPAPGELVLLADPRFVLKPQLYACARRQRLADLRQAGGKVFLKAATASSFWA